MTGKQLLLDHTTSAFSGRADMSLMASLKDITQEEASWRPDDSTPTAEQLVRHVAWAKTKYCHDGFGAAMVLQDPSVDENGDTPGIPWEFPCGAGFGAADAPGIEKAVELLEQAHRVVVQCLQTCTEESLERAIPGRHGKSAAHLFWILLMHDTYHAGQIRTRRKLSANARGA